MSKRLTHANLEFFRILSAYDSLFRMDVRTGQTWILSSKELIWKKVAEEDGPRQTVSR